MTSLPSTHAAAPGWGAPAHLARNSSTAAPRTEFTDRRAGAEPRAAAPRKRAPRELRAGVVLAVGWIALWAFFLVAVAHPAARLHASGAAAREPAEALAGR